MTYINNNRFYTHIEGQSRDRTVPIIFNWIKSEFKSCNHQDSNICIDEVYEILRADIDIQNYYYITEIKIFNDNYIKTWINPNIYDQTVQTHIEIDLNSDNSSLNFDIQKTFQRVMFSVFKSMTLSISDYSKAHDFTTFFKNYIWPRSVPSWLYGAMIGLLGFILYHLIQYREKELIEKINKAEGKFTKLSFNLGELNYTLKKNSVRLKEVDNQLDSTKKKNVELENERNELLDNNKNLEEKVSLVNLQKKDLVKFINQKRVMIKYKVKTDDWDDIRFLNNKNLVFIDSSSLMHPLANTYLGSTIRHFYDNGNQLIIPYRVIKELERLKNIKGSKLKKKRFIHKNKSAIRALGIVEKIKNESKAVIKGKEKDYLDDHIADNVFYKLFVHLREKYNLKLVTQDDGLAFDILLLNESRSSKQARVKEIDVCRIGKKGEELHSRLPFEELKYHRSDKPIWFAK